MHYFVVCCVEIKSEKGTSLQLCRVYDLGMLSCRNSCVQTSPCKSMVLIASVFQSPVIGLVYMTIEVLYWPLETTKCCRKKL